MGGIILEGWKSKYEKQKYRKGFLGDAAGAPLAHAARAMMSGLHNSFVGCVP